MADDEKHGAGHQTGDMRGHPPLARQRSHRVCFELCEEPENAELEVCVPYAAAPLTNGRHQWVLTFHLHDFTSVGDLKKAIYKQLRRDARGLQKESFMSGWLRLEGSSIVFQNDHPLFLVAQLLQRKPKCMSLTRCMRSHRSTLLIVRSGVRTPDPHSPGLGTRRQTQTGEGGLSVQAGRAVQALLQKVLQAPGWAPVIRYGVAGLCSGCIAPPSSCPCPGKNEDDKLKEIDLRGFTVLV